MVTKDTVKLTPEPCSLCKELIPPKSVILRKAETLNIICLICLLEIAALKEKK